MLTSVDRDYFLKNTDIWLKRNEKNEQKTPKKRGKNGFSSSNFSNFDPPTFFIAFLCINIFQVEKIGNIFSSGHFPLPMPSKLDLIFYLWDSFIIQIRKSTSSFRDSFKKFASEPEHCSLRFLFILSRFQLHRKMHVFQPGDQMKSDGNNLINHCIMTTKNVVLALLSWYLWKKRDCS